MGRRLLFLGPPGAGKGTQAKLLARTLGVPHVSTGEMLRAAVAAGTALGRRAEAIMAAGDLVPDELVIALVEERLAQPDAVCGYLLDGFPRNADQASALTEALGSDAIELAVLLDVPEDELVTRLLMRAEAEGRADDTESTIRRRLEVYRDETEPLVAYYGSAVAPIDGMGTVEEIFGRMALALAEPR